MFYDTIDVVQLARSLERSSTCKPFPNLLFALLYILIHGPHPMVHKYVHAYYSNRLVDMV